MKITLPFPPSNNHYKRHYCTVDGRHAVRAVLTDKAESFKDEAGWTAKDAARGTLMQGQLSMTIIAYRPRRSGDTDNIAKLALDALNGIVYEDDRQVVELHIYRRDDAGNPRLEITIEEVGE